MSDRLFHLEAMQRRKAQEGLSGAQAYEDVPQNNRLLAIEQSLTASRGDQSITQSYAIPLSQSEYADSFVEAFPHTAYVIDGRNLDGVAIHKSSPGSDGARVKSGGILDTGIAVRVPVGTRLDINWDVLSSDRNYVRCQHQGTAGYIRKTHLFNHSLFSPEDQVLQILRNSVLLAGFRKFTELEFSPENLRFFLACTDYEEFTEADDATLDSVFTRGCDLVTEFVLPSGSSSINIKIDARQPIITAHAALGIPARPIREIPQATLDAITQEMKSTFYRSTIYHLKAAKEEIKSLMGRDTCSRFFAGRNFDIRVVQAAMLAEARAVRARRTEQSLRDQGIMLSRGADYQPTVDFYT
jgi:hypothetical protein